jgi:hypothetical protein
MRRPLLKLVMASVFLYAAQSGALVELKAYPGECNESLELCEGPQYPNCRWYPIAESPPYINFMCDCGSYAIYGWCEV